MRTYILYKLLHAVGVAFVISLVSFFLLFYTADPASMFLGRESGRDREVGKKPLPALGPCSKGARTRSGFWPYRR